MYPWIRFVTTMVRGRRLTPMGALETHVSRHRVSLFDCDMFGELNNGRILTLYEFGRWQLALRAGLWDAMRKQGWGFAVAGASVRYRKRLVPFEHFEMRTRVLGWDARFVYVEQGMFKTSGECANHALFRTAIVSGGRAVMTERLEAEMPGLGASPALPDWAGAWIGADRTRPWPPFEETAT